MSDSGHENIWQWSHSMDLVTETFWAPGSPSNESKNQLDCGYIHHTTGNLLWYDDSCTYPKKTMAPVCERDIGVMSSTPTTTTTTTSKSTPTTTIIICPTGWSQFGASCFYFNDALETWHEARQQCNELNAELTSIHSDEELEFISNLIRSNQPTDYVYFGGNDIEHETYWSWTDGSIWDFTHWLSGRPHKSGKYQYNCLYYDPKTGYFLDGMCDYDGHNSVCRIN